MSLGNFWRNLWRDNSRHPGLINRALEENASVITASPTAGVSAVRGLNACPPHLGRMNLPDTLRRVDVHHDPLTCTCGQCGALGESRAVESGQSGSPTDDSAGQRAGSGVYSGRTRAALS